MKGLREKKVCLCFVFAFETPLTPSIYSGQRLTFHFAQVCPSPKCGRGEFAPLPQYLGKGLRDGVGFVDSVSFTYHPIP